MTYNPDIHDRQTIRLKSYDYRSAGVYFITVCCQNRECLFGKLDDGKMALNQLGKIVCEEWQRTPLLRPYVFLDEFIIMPNHFHGIMIFSDEVGATRWVAQNTSTSIERATQRVAPTGPASGSIGAIIGQFKSASTKRIRDLQKMAGLPVWQRNFYERIVRSDEELHALRMYIRSNPSRWSVDEENPSQHAGKER